MYFFKFFCTIIFLATGCSASIDRIEESKRTIQKAFTYVSKDEFDSLRPLFPIILRDSFKTDFIKIKFKDISEVVKVEGIPSLSVLQVHESDYLNNDYKVTFLSKRSDIHKVDSIEFFFAKHLPADKVAVMRVYSRNQELRPLLIPPPGE